MNFPADKYTICKTLNGNQTYFFRCVGFCTYHKVYVTANQARFKKCAAKHCSAMIRTDHPYWRERELKKQLRKMRKENGGLPLNPVMAAKILENETCDEFAARCVEIYATFTNRTLTNVYETFCSTKLHEHLLKNRNALFLLEDSAIINYCDDWIQNSLREIH